MPKFTDDELKEWLNTPGSMQLIKSDKHNSDVLVKIPYNQDFDLLFCSHVWNADNLRIDENLENAGLYYRKDGCIYNASYSLRHCCEDSELILENSDKEYFAEKLTELVKAKVEEIIDNKRSNISIKKLSDGYLLNQMQYYSEHGAAREAKSAFIKGDEPSDIVYKCPYSVDSMSDADYIQFIADKEPLVEREEIKRLCGDVSIDLIMAKNTANIHRVLRNLFYRMQLWMHTQNVKRKCRGS